MTRLTLDVPDYLWEAMQAYLSQKPSFDESKLAIAALCLFLMQDATIAPTVQSQLSRTYLDCLFKKELTNV